MDKLEDKSKEPYFSIFQLTFESDWGLPILDVRYY